MKSVSDGQLERAIRLLAEQGNASDKVEAEMVALVGDKILARRLIDWIPEAFGAVLIGHMQIGLRLPQTFRAKDAQGVWQEFPLSVEPIFVQAVEAASVMYHNGPREVFVALAPSGCMVDAVNTALNAGEELSGATVSGPALLGIPAETYIDP